MMCKVSCHTTETGIMQNCTTYLPQSILWHTLRMAYAAVDLQMAYWYVLWHFIHTLDSEMYLATLVGVKSTGRGIVDPVVNDRKAKSGRIRSRLTQLHHCHPRNPCNPSPASVSQPLSTAFHTERFVFLPLHTTLGHRPSNLHGHHSTVYKHTLRAVGPTPFQPGESHVLLPR